MNKESSGKIKDEAQRVAANVEEYIRLEAVEKLTVIVTKVIVTAVVFVLALCSFIFICFGFVHTLVGMTGNETLSYYLVGVAVLIVLVLFLMFSKRIVENWLVRVFSSALLGGERLMTKVDSAADVDIQGLAQSLSDELNDYDEGGM